MEKLSLLLGDAIKIDAPTNAELHDQLFIITYIDPTLIKIINTDTLSEINLNIKDNGELSEETIVSISLISRSDKNGYSRQNELLPNTWIDIYFGGELPQTITGEITNLEEDMIEIKLYPSQEIIYLDFAYKGLPPEYNIEKIIIRESPVKKLSEDVRDQEEEEQQESENNNISENIINNEYNESDSSNIFDEVDIEMGDTLGSITQVVEVSDEEKRFDINAQCNDLLDELLSTIPNSERTSNTLKYIHLEINRFKQLRSKFSNLMMRAIL